MTASRGRPEVPGAGASQAIRRVCLGGDPCPYALPTARAGWGFSRFLRPGCDGLFDVIAGPDGTDPSMRPNQTRRRIE
jgi:hypothetical protein